MSDLRIIGSTVRLVDAGRALHRLPNEIVMAGLLSGPGMVGDIPQGYGTPWFACVMFSDGTGTLRGNNTTTPPPPDDAADTLYELAVRLNREEHRGGHWVTVWAKGCLNAFWRDADGDLHVTIGFDDAWPRIRALPVSELVARCVEAHDTYLGVTRTIGAHEFPTHLRALGEASNASRH